MKIISKIEINYFRSVYSVTLAKNNDINVLVGGNDVGKSNILKAVNLFFNNKSEIDTAYNFNDDLSRQREQEAKETKGRAFLWIRVTFNNFLGWESLPDTFSIKKTWNRYSATPETTNPQNVPSAMLGKFLNKLSFHYIPAVRGKDIYQHYLNELHDALIDDEQGIRNASDALIRAINTSTEDMSERVQQGIGIRSSIQVPKDLRDLFTALDFSTKYSEFEVPLQKRGDGIQARHIPFILDFIARHSNKYHIWAYEEPENSLEMGKAFDLASQFFNDFSKKNQIYLTTHSPAFYDLSGDRVNKWMVSSYIDNNYNIRTQINELQGHHGADMSLGLASLISERAKHLYQEINDLNKTKEELAQAVSRATIPQVLVEGPTDVIILNTAFNKLYGDKERFCVFSPAGGAAKITSYLKSLKDLVIYDGVKVIGLYDNDQEGILNYQKFQSLHNFEHTDFKIVRREHVFCGFLPIPAHLDGIVKGRGVSIPIPIEFMFPPDSIALAIDSGHLVMEEITREVKDSSYVVNVNITDQIKSSLPDEYHYLSYKINDDSKASFAAYTSEMSIEIFEGFRPLFELIGRICE